MATSLEEHAIITSQKKPLASYICHDPKSLASSKHKEEKAQTRSASSSSYHFRRVISADSRRSNPKSLESSDSRMVGPLIDEDAITAVVGILSGYIGRYVKDYSFRKTIKEKCTSFLDRRRKKDSDDEIFKNMELSIEKIDRLVEDQKVIMMKSLRSSIEVLTKVASLNSKSYLIAFAQLYIAIAYKLQKNEKVSSIHLLQVFCNSPNLARTYLLPDLWDHLFLPHLLHLKIWFTRELEFLSNEEYGDEKEKKMKVLSKVYNDKMDSGTTLFAMYYKQWLKVGGASEPPLPFVSLPLRPSYRSSRRRSSDSSISNSSFNPNL